VVFYTAVIEKEWSLQSSLSAILVRQLLLHTCKASSLQRRIKTFCWTELNTNCAELDYHLHHTEQCK